MKFVDHKVHFIPGQFSLGIKIYGYQYDDNLQVYWSMRFYEETWHIPMHPSFLN